MILQPPTNPAQKRFDSDFYVEGYPATFDTPYSLFKHQGLDYYEVIERGAFDDADTTDVIMLFDHTGKPLARKSNNTLGLEVDQKGLFMFADLSKSNAARDLYGEIESELLTRMSYAFKVAENGDYYDPATRTRHIRRVRKVYDVSAVTFPANPDTEIAVRSYFNGVIEIEKQELLKRTAALESLILKIKLGVIV